MAGNGADGCCSSSDYSPLSWTCHEDFDSCSDHLKPQTALIGNRELLPILREAFVFLSEQQLLHRQRFNSTSRKSSIQTAGYLQLLGRDHWTTMHPISGDRKFVHSLHPALRWGCNIASWRHIRQRLLLRAARIWLRSGASVCHRQRWK